MARIPEITRNNPLSQVAAGNPAPSAGAGWEALAKLAKIGEDFVHPAAVKEAADQGSKDVYRDADGTLKVKEASVLGGEMADVHNSAAYAKYLAQRKIDMSQSFTEMARTYEFDPAGFKQAADGYIKIMREDETVPTALRDELLIDAQAQTSQRFNGLYDRQTEKTYREADRNTSTLRDMMADDYTNLVLGGDQKAADAKMKEIEDLSTFRASAGYISETPAETASYLRGVRGAAKAAELAQTLSGLTGATSISDDLRKQIDATMKDPDISPEARQKLYSATRGILKGVDAAGIVSGLTDGSYASKVIRVESGGNANATNSTSSASGLAGFTNGTWMQSVRELQAQGGAAWAKGLSNDDILDMRKNGAASKEVLEHFTAQNQRALAGAGLPVNDATTYMAHFFGVGGAIKVLSADPSALISDLLPEAAKANGFLQGMTVVDAQNWAARKMTMKASDIAAQQIQIDQIPDPEMRALASDALSERFKARKNIEDAAAAEYDARLASKSDALTEQEIFQDQSLGDRTQVSLSNKLAAKNKDRIELQQTVASLANPAAPLDFGDAKTRSAVDGAYKAVIGDQGPLSDVGVRAAGEIVATRGYFPKPAFDAVMGAINGTDPVALARSMEVINQAVSSQPAALQYQSGNSTVMDALSDYRFYSGFVGGEAAAAKMLADRTPEAIAKRKNLSDAASAAAKNLKPADFPDYLSGKNVSASLGNEGQQGEMMSEYERLFKDAFIDTGDTGRAKERALSTMSRIYGPDGVTGSNTLMKFPPQNFYPHPLGSDPNWMQAQLVDDVSNMAYGKDRTVNNVGGRSGHQVIQTLKTIPANRISIMSDETTRKEIAAGKPPSYMVGYFDDDGHYQQNNQRFHFDPAAALAQGSAASKAAMDAAQTYADQHVRRDNLMAWTKYLDKTKGLGAGAVMSLDDMERYATTKPPEN